MRYKGFRIKCDLQLDRNEAVTVYVLFMVEFRGFEWDVNNLMNLSIRCHHSFSDSATHYEHQIDPNRNVNTRGYQVPMMSEELVWRSSSVVS